jgi:hypothetical protein
MKAKTTKFLAVLAVLAVAFAGVAVLAQADIEVFDAAAEEGASERVEGHNVSMTIGEKTTYYTTAAKAFSAVKSKETATITLLSTHEGAGLQTPEGVTESNVTVDFAGFTYKVNEPVGSTGYINQGAQLKQDNTYVLKSGTITTTSAEYGIKNMIHSYAITTLTDMIIDGTNLVGGYNWCEDPETTAENKMTIAVWVENGTTIIDGSTTIVTGTAGKTNYGLGVSYWPDRYADGAQVTVDTTGQINGILMALDAAATHAADAKASTLDLKNAKVYGEIYSYENMQSGKLTIDGVIVPKGKTLTLGGAIAVDGILSMEYGSVIKAGTVFTYTDEYGDAHSFSTNKQLDVGMDGFTVASGDNMILVDGTVTLTEETTYTCTGNVTISGMVYTKPTTQNAAAVGLILTNAQADIKLRTFQVTDGGAVTLSTPVLVMEGCSFYAAGNLTVTKTLKVAEGAVVKTEGDLTVNGSIWNAGQFIAKDYTGMDDKLIRVFMNTSYPTGTFYKGASVYPVLTVAFGAYLDMTGKSTVNLTSGGIDVINNLYKYRTLILATFNDTIALTAIYDNQYPVEVDLEKKAYIGPEMTAKSATFRNVVWESPESAILYVVAPEVYTVTLAKDVVEDEQTGKWIVNPEVEDNVWKSGLTIIDQDDRVIPISTVDATKGQIKVVFGYEYIIVGATESSKYKFESPNGELEDLKSISKTAGVFTMIRNNAENPEVPVIMHITEGIASVITVDLTVADNTKSAKMTDGDPFLSYKIEEDGAVIALPYASGEKAMQITGIYSNDKIYFMPADKDFVKFTLGENAWTGGTIPVVAEFKNGEWTETAAVTGIENDKSERTLKVNVAADKATVTYTLADASEVATGQKITVTWDKASPDQTVTVLDRTITQTFDVYADEIVKIEWTNVDPDHVRLAMKVAGEDYEAGTAITVPNGIVNTTATLTATKILYVQVTNNTDKQIIVSDNTEHQRIIEKTKTNEEALELVLGETEAGNTVAVKVGVKGQAVVSWHYKVLREAVAPATEPTLIVEADVIGDTTTITGVAQADTVAGYSILESDIIEISNLSTVPVAYIVKTQPTEHSQIGDYSRVGNMGDNMFIYVKADEGFTIPGVEVWNEDPNHEGFPGTFYDDAVFDKSEKYWTYTMPDNNVVLIIKEQKETYDLTYVNQDGEVVIAKRAVKTGSAVTDEVPYYVGKTAASAVPNVEIPGFNFDRQNQTISFNMPEADVVVTINYVDDDYSKNVMVTVGQRGADIALVITALDGKTVASGTIYMTVTYTYLDEDGEISTDNVTVPVTFKADGSAHAVVYDNEFIEELGENYSGAFAVTGTFEFGLAVGSLFKTVYTPVLEA